MRTLVDTNVLARFSQRDHPMRAVAARSLKELGDQGYKLRVVPQVVYEYWVVATRPVGENGLGFTVEETKLQLATIKELFPPLRDERGILEPWEQLVAAHRVQGKRAHDARLVAAMMRHGLTYLLTFNVGDFTRYPGITVMRPGDETPLSA